MLAGKRDHVANVKIDNAPIRLSIDSLSKKIKLKGKSEETALQIETKDRPNVAIISDRGSFVRRKWLLEMAAKESFHKRVAYEVAEDRNILSD